MTLHTHCNVASPAGTVLFVFDGGLTPAQLESISDLGGASVSLLPLCSDFPLVESIRLRLLDMGAARVLVLDSAAMVDAEVDIIRESICEWVRCAGEVQVAGKSLTSWFFVERYHLSTWWLSLLAENNSLKTRIHLQLAQLRAIKTILKAGSVGRLVVSLGDKSLAGSLKGLANGETLPFHALVSSLRVSKRERILWLVRRAGWVGEFFLGFLAWLRLCAQATYVRFSLGTSESIDDGMLIATYFPAFESNSACAGIFRNRYTGELQGLLERKQIPVAWLLIYAPLSGIGFRQAVSLAAQFRKQGGRLIFPEQFLSPLRLAEVLVLWLRQAYTAQRFGEESLNHLAAIEPMCAGSQCLLEDLWRASFAGPAALLSVAYMIQFRAMWRQGLRPRGLAYICEMQSWEKALLGSRRGLRDDVPALAIQHTVVAREYYHYFASPLLTAQSGDLSMPQADILAVNGPAVATLLSSCGYRNLREVEALRYTHLEANRHPVSSGVVESILLLIGSYDRNEARAMLRLVHAAFPLVREGGVMLKSHPAMPLEGVCDDLGIDWFACGYRVAEGIVDGHLRKATAVVVGSSAVAIEAAILGKPVMVPRFSDAVVMSPIAGLSCYTVMQPCSPEELRQCWENVLAHPVSGPVPPPYWHLEPDLRRWEALLDELGLPGANI